MVEPLDFKSIHIANLKDVNITIPDEPWDYGRQFTVKLGDSEKEVVFKDLYKKARKLLKENDNLSKDELKEIDAFISRLKNVEKEGKAKYKAQGSFYKFRTFFHRLFGGAYRGTHLGRLDKLQNKLGVKSQVEFSKNLKNNLSHYRQHFRRETEIPVGDKTFVAKIVGPYPDKLLIWDKSKPQDITVCKVDYDFPHDIYYQNFKAIAGNALSIFEEISHKLDSRVILEHDNVTKRDDVINLYEKLQMAFPDHSALTDPVVIDGKTYLIEAKASLSFSGFKIRIQEEGMVGTKGVLKITNGKTEYEGYASGVPEEFGPVLDELHKRVEGKRDEIEVETSKINEEGRIREALVLLYHSLFDQISNDSALIDPIIIDGITYTVQNISGTRISIQEVNTNADELLEIERGQTMYANKKGRIPEKFLPVLNELLARIQNRSNEIRLQNVKRDELVALCEKIFNENPYDSVLQDSIVIDGKKFTIQAKSRGSKLKIQEEGALGNGSPLKFVRGGTKYQGRSFAGIPDEQMPVVNELHTRLQVRLNEIKSITEKRDEVIGLYQKILEMDPNSPVFQDPIVVDGKKYLVKKKYGLNLEIQALGNIGINGLLSIDKGISWYETRKGLIPEELVLVLDGMGNRLLVRWNEFEKQEINSNPELNGFFDDPEVFDKAIVFLERQSLNGILGNVNAWTKDGVLNIQEKKYKDTEQGLLQIAQNRSIIFEGNNEAAIPENAKHILKVALFNACAASYIKIDENKIKISIVREGLQYIPNLHLSRFTKFNSTDFEVKYEGEDGVDLGGLKREYIGNLASIISNRESLFAEADGSLKIPRILRESKDSVPYCDLKERETYQSFGKLFALCYESEQTGNYYESELITTGRLFSDVIFKAAFSLSARDLNKAVTSRESQIKMSKIILTYLDKQSNDVVIGIIKCLELLEEGMLEASLMKSKEELQDGLVLAHALLGEAVGETYVDEDTFLPDIAKIETNKDQFKEDLFNALMKDPNLVGELKGVPLGSMLDPIFHIAKGMSEKLSSWEAERIKAVDAFSSKIQGSIDRNKIVASIVTVNHPVLNQKVLWLKEWIQNDATDVEIKSFLKFVTGSTSLAGSTQIKVDAQSQPSPLAGASSCNMTIHMSNKMSYGTGKTDGWDNTKEKFIRNLKASIAQEGFQLS